VTPNQAKELLPVIEAFAQGRAVQYSYGEGWKETGCPNFDAPDVIWRIKPDAGQLLYEGLSTELKWRTPWKDLSFSAASTYSKIANALLKVYNEQEASTQSHML